MKCQCGNNLFFIQQIPCCDDCSENPAWFDGGYTYDEKIIAESALPRTGIDHEGECSFGRAPGAACFLFTCSACNKRSNLAFVEGC